MSGFGAFGQRHDLMVGKHSGFVCHLSTRSTQRLTAGVAVVHHPYVLCKKRTYWSLALVTDHDDKVESNLI